ncbi:MAG: Hpt domain-containing protein [Aggregatilineales bacterium]
MDNADNELLSIFRDEVGEHLRHLNNGLLQVEMVDGDEKLNILREMNRYAHSMKGAARAVGFVLVEDVSHHMEEIFHHALDKNLAISPDVADTLYDGLDLIQHVMDGVDNDDEHVQLVLRNLAHIVAGEAVEHEAIDLPEQRNGTGEHDDLAHDSTEMPVLHMDEHSMPEKAKQVASDTDSDLYRLFKQEATDILQMLNESLLQVEMTHGKQRTTLLQEMNRHAHSMKGAARAVGFGMIESIAAVMEDIFHDILENNADLTPNHADSLYDGLDVMQQALDDNAPEISTVAQVLSALEQILRDTTPSSPITENDPPTVETPAPVPERQVPSLQTATVEASGLSATTIMRPAEETLRVTVSKLDVLMAEASELLVARMQGELHERRVIELQRKHARWQREWRSVRTSYIRLVRRLQDLNDEIPAEMQTIFKFLESNQRHLTEANHALAQLRQILAQDNMQLSTLADGLQDTVSGLRMMPFESIMGGFQRMVRDIARDTDKQVQLDVAGVNVEIDKTVLDALKDPIMHLLRNAIDHGLENPEDRQHAGKSPVGRINLSVEQRGSEIILGVEDDGRGLNTGKIRRKAVERGLLSEAAAFSLSDDETRLLIFQSGFSTSDEVTSLSGRGLGMDIVRERVEGLRGRVGIHSTPGAGTQITLNVPVSLTRIRAILLRTGDEDYAIPSTMVERMDVLPRDRIFMAEGRELVMINDHPMPLASLGALLQSPGTTYDEHFITVLVLKSADRSIAFEVDRLYSEMELVLKPLGPELSEVPYIAGAALMGSGDVLIILDANDLVRRVSGMTLNKTHRKRKPVNDEVVQRPLRVLVADDSITTRTLEKNILEAVGFEVHVAIDGAEAWAMLAHFEPDVIISDVEMPNMTGLELAKMVKSSGHTQHIPLILLTSLSKPEQREAGLHAGADAYLVKSRFDQGELLSTIQSVL